MAGPEIAQKSPFVMELETGNYWWCQCGRSKNQPFCDGTHKGTDIRPVQFTIDEKKKYALCGCKHTKNNPFCDGEHKRI